MTHPENTDFVRRILAEHTETAYLDHKSLIAERDAIQERASKLASEVSVLYTAIDILDAAAAKTINYDAMSAAFERHHLGMGLGVDEMNDMLGAATKDYLTIPDLTPLDFGDAE